MNVKKKSNVCNQHFSWLLTRPSFNVDPFNIYFKISFVNVKAVGVFLLNEYQ